jgi:hypothetical protein
MRWLSNCQVFKSAPLSVDKSIGGRSRTLEARDWNPACFRSSPTWGGNKRAALVGRSRRAAPVWIYRSHGWTAVTRAPLAIKLIRVGVQGSQARQHGDALFAPRLPGVLRFAEHGEFSLVV